LATSKYHKDEANRQEWVPFQTNPTIRSDFGKLEELIRTIYQNFEDNQKRSGKGKAEHTKEHIDVQPANRKTDFSSVFTSTKKP